MTVRTLRLDLEEAGRLLTVFSDAFSTPLLETAGIDEYIRKLSDHAWFLIMEQGGEAAAFSTYYMNDELRQLYVSLLGVRKDLQGQGAGKILMRETVRIAEEAGYSSIGLEVDKDNVRAYNYYVKQGFEISQDREKKYLMVKKL